MENTQYLDVRAAWAYKLTIFCYFCILKECSGTNLFCCAKEL